MQVAGDFLSQIDINYVCCEELRAKVNLCRMPVDIAYKKTTAHLDDPRSASTRVSDLLKKVEEQDWKNHHVYSFCFAISDCGCCLNLFVV